MSIARKEQKILMADLNPVDSSQSAVWRSDFGRDYTDRNTLHLEALDELYKKNYGITRRALNKTFLRDVSTEANFLEVGCNAGNQLLLLQEMGYSKVAGVELQAYALEIARLRLPGADLKLGSALSLPRNDASFDVVFTSGVLIHIAPKDLSRAMDEIYRCTRSYIWGMEYYAAELTEVQYRDHSGLLWKMDYAQAYLDRFPDLELLLEQRLPYIENGNVDSMFLLRKKR
jgi:pseudaminic acid biosynthesis-associated methylase